MEEDTDSHVDPLSVLLFVEMLRKSEKQSFLGSIKGRIILYVTLSTILIIAVNAVVNSIVLNDALKTSEHSVLSAEAEGTSDIIDEWLVGQANIVETMKNVLQSMDKEDTEGIMDFLEVNLANNEEYFLFTDNDTTVSSIIEIRKKNF